MNDSKLNSLQYCCSLMAALCLPTVIIPWEEDSYATGPLSGCFWLLLAITRPCLCQWMSHKKDKAEPDVLCLFIDRNGVTCCLKNCQQLTPLRKKVLSSLTVLRQLDSALLRQVCKRFLFHTESKLRAKLKMDTSCALKHSV